MYPPEHVAIIMDGNGRWANRRGLPRAAGHRAGAKCARNIVRSAQENGVQVLTLFAFSSENWQRPKAEVRLLMDLFRGTIRRQIDALYKNGVRLHFIGARDHFSRSLRDDMAAAEKRTADNTALDLVVAVDYGGRWDVLQASRQIARDCLSGKLDPETVDERNFGAYMSLDRFPQPDLFIRTGGERRVSNFLLWDLAYSELYFTDVLWPDFDAECFTQALRWYQQRERRFGQLSRSATRDV